MSRSWDFCFLLLKRFGRFEAVASLDAYQIDNYQFPSKTCHFFCCLIFEEFEKEFLNRDFMANYLNRRDQNIHLVFKRMCPMEHQGLLFKWFQGKNECLLGLLAMTTNSFENSITKNLETFIFLR